MTARAFLGAGDLYIARYNGGVLGAFAGPYECEKFEIKPNVDLKEKTSKGRNTYGQVIESVAIPQPADLTVDLSEVNKESLAIALLGTVAAITQTQGTLTNESVTITALDTWYPLSKAWLTSITATDSETTPNPLVEGVDFIVDKDLGWIKVLSTSSLVQAADIIKVSGSYKAMAGDEIKAMTNAQLRVRFKLVGKNFADDLPYTVTVYEAVIAADAAFDFLQDEFGTVSLPGRMKTPAGFTEPASVVLMRTNGA
jgi:hypothetical protein